MPRRASSDSHSQIPTSATEQQHRHFYYGQIIWGLRMLLIALFAMAGYVMLSWYSKIYDQRSRAEIYWQDGIGRRDFASRFSGGRIIDVLTTSSATGAPVHPAFSALDKTLRSKKCWDVHDSTAQLAVKFANPLVIEQITVDHIPKELLSGLEIRSVPRELLLWGIRQQNVTLPLERSQRIPRIHHPMYHYNLLRKLEYDIKSDHHIQTFNVEVRQDYDGVVVEILSNWGAPNTLVCRIRIHGRSLENVE